MVIVTNHPSFLSSDAINMADVIVTRQGVVVKNRNEAHTCPLRVKRALQLLGIKED
jgi:hypothetical protein